MFNLIAIEKNEAYVVKTNVSRKKAEIYKNLLMLTTETYFYITKLDFTKFCEYKKVSPRA